MQHELVALQGAVQALFERDAGVEAPLHLLGEELEAVAPTFLGAVHGDIGLAQQHLGVGAVVRIGADADAAGDDVLLPGQQHRDAEPFADPFGDRARHGVADRVVEQHDEFVAAKTGDGVGLAHAQHQLRGDDAQQFVADAVAERVVDALEFVEVDEHHRQPRTMALGAPDRMAEAVEEQRAVRQAGQQVVGGLVLHRLLVFAPLGDVVRHVHDRIGVVEADRAAEKFDFDQAAIEPLDLQRATRLALRSGDVGVGPFHHLVAELRRHPLQCFGADQLFGRAGAEQRAGGRIGEHDPPARCGSRSHPESVRPGCDSALRSLPGAN